MSLALDFSEWAVNASNWLGIVNESTSGTLDMLLGFVIGRIAVLVLYNYLHKASA